MAVDLFYRLMANSHRIERSKGQKFRNYPKRWKIFERTNEIQAIQSAPKICGADHNRKPEVHFLKSPAKIQIYQANTWK